MDLAGLALVLGHSIRPIVPSTRLRPSEDLPQFWTVSDDSAQKTHQYEKLVKWSKPIIIKYF